MSAIFHANEFSKETFQNFLPCSFTYACMQASDEPEHISNLSDRAFYAHFKIFLTMTIGPAIKPVFTLKQKLK